MTPNKTLFTIHLIEDETGCVRVMSESVGAGMNAHDIGLEILANLKAAEHENPGVLYVAPFTYSEYRQ